MFSATRLGSPKVHCATIMLALITATSTFAQWHQWGGPRGDFVVDAPRLADRWPAEGPRVIWRRPLGDGYATIAIDDGRLFTMYRRQRLDPHECVIALDAKTGKTLWEHACESPLTENMVQFGGGPHTAPLVVGQRVFTTGANLDLHCFDTETGTVLWQRDLLEQFDLTVPTYGYAASPLAYKGAIVLPVGGSGATEQALTAIDQETGQTRWTSPPVPRALSEYSEYSTPRLINFDGRDQFVFLTNHRVVGFDAADGTPLWEFPHVNRQGVSVSTPVWDGKDVLAFSAAYGVGTRAIRLTKVDGQIVPEELWFTRKLRIHHGNAVLIGDHMYASTGDFGPAFFMGINIYTGKIAWRERGYKKACPLVADGKLIFLDEDGTLVLATATPQGLDVLSQCKLTERISWTVPTLAGTTLYVRDRNEIMALTLQ